MSENIHLFGTRRPRERVLATNNLNGDANWNWLDDQRYTLYTTGGEEFTGRLPYFSDTSPVRQQLSVHDVNNEDGWALLYRNFGSPEEGTEVPRFFLYNRFQGILRFFFFNYKIETAFSSAFVRLRLINTGVGTSTPPLLTFSAGNPSLWNPGLARPDGYQGEYLDNYDMAREVLAVTRLAFKEWCYADFLLVGYDPQLGSAKYTDSAFGIEVVGVDEAQLQVDGRVSLAPLYEGGSSNVLTDLGSLINQIPGGAIVRVVTSWFGSKEAANTADQEKAEKERKPSAKSTLQSLAGAALKDYLPGIGKVAGFIGKLIGGTSSKKLTELKGTVSLTGTLTRSSRALYTYLRVPGVQHSGQDAMPFDMELGIINLATEPWLQDVDHTYECQPDPFDPRVEVCHDYFKYRGGPIAYALNDTIDGARSVRAEAAIANLQTGITATEFVNINSFSTLSVDEMVAALSGQSGVNTRWYAIVVRVIIEPETADSVPVYVYNTYVPNYISGD